MRVATWNLEWARPGSRRERLISEILVGTNADIICLTEAFSATLPADGHMLVARNGNGVADRLGAKKVVLWSRTPWECQDGGVDLTPAGRYASGRTTTELGELRVFGVCIPWRGSNTTRYGGTRAPWDDHLQFVDQLKTQIASAQMPTIVIGDFNQRLPPSRQPRSVARALEASMNSFIVATRGFRGSNGDLTIDHIAHSHALAVDSLYELPASTAGVRLSDHFGIVASIRPA